VMRSWILALVTRPDLYSSGGSQTGLQDSSGSPSCGLLSLLHDRCILEVARFFDEVSPLFDGSKLNLVELVSLSSLAFFLGD